MAEDYGQCNLCRKGKFAKKDEREIGGSTYYILKCEKCGHEVARSIK